jgi:hypothetical protein
MVTNETQIELVQRLLINLGSTVTDPVVQKFTTHLLDDLKEADLDSFVESINTEHNMLVLPVQLNNFARRRMNIMLCDIITRYVSFIRTNNKVPPSIHQAFVNASHTYMDYHKIEILHNFSSEWA